MGGAVSATVVQVVVAWARRRERAATEAELREDGLPVRQRVISWKVVALLCYFAGPFAVMLAGALVSLPVALVRDPDLQFVLGIWVALMLGVTWVVASTYLTWRQWRRQRRVDAAYWRRYRAALARSAEARAGGDRSTSGPLLRAAEPPVGPRMRTGTASRR